VTRGSGRGASQPDGILAWRDAIETAVLSTELRRAVVANREADCRDILPRKQPHTRFLKSDPLLVLDRRHGGNRTEMPVERRYAHSRHS
jgi:hypothetical protein